MTAISYKCPHCDQENWTEDTKRGTFRDCNHCGRPVQVPGGQNTTTPGLKTCPYCAETDLQPAAKVCKHCGKKLDGGGHGCLLNLAIICLVAGVLVFPPLILPGIALGLVWIILRLL